MMFAYLYHASYGVNRESILKDGLKLPNGKSNFGMYAGEYIYLATTPEVAESFAECADEKIIPDDWLEDIAVFQVKVLVDDLEPDPNNKLSNELNTGSDSCTYVISHDISAENIKEIHKNKNGEFEKF